jgi:hypothetical protein
MRTIQYTINGHHNCHLSIAAQVVPIDIQLSRNVLEFRFAPDAVLPEIKEFITLQNKSNARAEFSFAGLSPPFSMDHPLGHIDSYKSLNIEVVYSPTTKSHDEQTVTLNVVGGPSRSLKVIGDTGAPKCSLAKKTVNFGLIPIGIAKTQVLKLKNSGEDDAIFSVSLQNTAELQVSPMNGRVTGHEFVNLQLEYKSGQPRYFDIAATVTICGAPPLTFNVIGQSELPQVHLQKTEFDFGRVFVGSSSALDVLLTNDGAIPAILFLDLQSRPDFRIEYATEFQGNNSISIVSDPTFVTKLESSSEYMSSGGSTRLTSPAAPRGNKADEDAPQGLFYKLQLSENTTLQFSLIFQPTCVADHSFELPITMMNVIGSSSFHLQPLVVAEGVQAPLAMSTTSISFGVAPVFNPNSPNSRPRLETVTLSNDGRISLEWRFDEFPATTYMVEPTNGSIERGGRRVVHISFTPHQPIPYNCYLPLYVKTEHQDNLVGKLQLTGMGSSVLFRVRTTDICLPIVPLGTKCQRQINVYNEAFVETYLKVVMAVDEARFPLRVTFPEGNHLQCTTTKLPILVSFQSSSPMSFSTLVALTDDQGNATTFTVACTTDNSIFTLYPFFASKAKAKSGVIDYKGISDNYELTAKMLSVEDFKQLKKCTTWEPSFPSMTVEFFIRYLNALVLSTQLSTFPGDFISSQGALLMEAVANLSGGKKAHVDPEKGQTEEKRNEALHRMLQFLISNGALLSSVRAEFLLSRDEFVHFMRKKITKQLLGLDYYNAPPLSSFDQQVLAEFTSSKSFSLAVVDQLKILEEKFNALSLESWMMVLMQVFKIFVIGKIDPDRFSSIPGVSDVLKQVKVATQRFSNAGEVWNEINKTAKSQTYSASESCLLRWAGLYYCYSTDDYTKRLNDFTSLTDSLAISEILKVHCNIRASNLNEHATDRTQKEQNAIELTNAMKELKLAFRPRAKEIVNGTVCTLAVIVAYLMDVLPHYLPQSVLEFATTLHKPITRSINLQNPSKSELTYRATYEGSPNFVLLQDTIVIPSGQSAEFPINFLARTLKPCSGRISLMASRPRYVPRQPSRLDQESLDGAEPSRMPQYSAPIVVDLASNVTILAPNVSVNLEGPNYATSKVSINVTNLIGAPATMSIYLRASRIEDENGKSLEGSKSLSDQIMEFIQSPKEPHQSKSLDSFANFITSHRQFISSLSEIVFESEKSSDNLEIEFIPITLGTFRCLLLFSDDNTGEFIYQVIAKSVLPPPVDVTSAKLKVECGKKISVPIQADPLNTNLTRAMAYAIERQSTGPSSERKFKDLCTRRQRDLENMFKQGLSQMKFTIVCSASQFFNVPTEVVLTKGGATSFPVTFRPGKAGDYPCKLLLTSTNDIRLYSLKGLGTSATKELSVEFSTVAGKAVKQDIPIQNTSNDVWTFKITCTGDQAFSAPQRLQLKGQTSQYLPVIFAPFKIGSHKAEISIFNQNKESNLIYSVVGIAEEPPAEEKIVIKCQARSATKVPLAIRSFTKSGPVDVNCTIPIVRCPTEIMFANGEPSRPFEYEIDAPRSGVSAGTITFTDRTTKNYVWYVIEIHVDFPKPEQSISVSTIARMCTTVQIPISNPKDHLVKFTVHFGDDDLFGDKEFTLAAHESVNYKLLVSPLRAMKKNSAVYFYSDDDGEFWYSIKIDVEEAPVNILAPMTAPIGKFATTVILLENPSRRSALFRVENDNSAVFQVMAKRVIQVQPMEKRRVDVQYIPTSVGIKETALVSFRSAETGDWQYRLTGTGKPPQPQSPTIVSASIENASSALVIFVNPFPYPARFAVSLTHERDDEMFKFLVRRKVFTLTQYSEEFQIPFTFTPTSLGQFQAHIIVASLGPARGALPELETLPNVRWVYPIIGNSIASNVSEIKVLKCRAHEKLETKVPLTLVGETEVFQVTEYTKEVRIPPDYEFIRPAIEFQPLEIKRKENVTEMDVFVTFLPKRPLNQTVTLLVTNPLRQEWHFKLELSVDLGKVQESLMIESLLNKLGVARIQLPVVFSSSTPFHAYFASGSASEFSVSPSHGMIEPTFLAPTELPMEVVFAPKMYGKVLKGMLVVDTLDAQYLFDVLGKTPEYVPPVVTRVTKEIEVARREDAQSKMEAARRRRNIIRENIENAKIVKPRPKTVMKSFP